MGAILADESTELEDVADAEAEVDSNNLGFTELDGRKEAEGMSALRDVMEFSTRDGEASGT